MLRQVNPGIGRNLPFTRQVNLYTGPGRETPILVLTGQGTDMVYPHSFSKPPSMNNRG